MDVTNKHIVVLGAARSGLAVARLLKHNGARVFVSDLAEAGTKSNEIIFLQKEAIAFEFGVHSDKILEADFIVLSPGIPPTSTVVKRINARGIPIFSELEIAYRFCQSPIIAITGSNGKTTTTTLLGEMLRWEKPQSIVAGNIGEALSDHVAQSQPSDWAAVEVSSFQLETIDQFHPRIVVLLNLAPNHLDWYENYEAYVAAKIKIIDNLDQDDYLIYNGDDDLLVDKIKNSPAHKECFSLKNTSARAYYKGDTLYLDKKPLVAVNEMPLRGKHNYQNAMAAAMAAEQTGIKILTIQSVLKSFHGVEHRLEFVSTINGIHFINDSKATTVESLAVALNSFKTPIILIAGGKDKGGDYSKLNHLIKQNVRKVVLIGAASPKMAQTWQDLVPVHLSSSLQSAIADAFSAAEKGDNVLLSPACSSFDMFKDFEDRGRQFKHFVHELKEKYESK